VYYSYYCICLDAVNDSSVVVFKRKGTDDYFPIVVDEPRKQLIVGARYVGSTIIGDELHK